MSSAPPAPRIASPAATGGAGTLFEQHVDAFWLVLLLVRAIPPVLRDSTVVELHLQARHLGWATDDMLVVGETAGGSRRRLLGQTKRSFTVSSTDAECVKTIEGFWSDFTNPAFVRTTDRFVLTTLHGTNVLLRDFRGLLDTARSALDGADFERRTNLEGMITSHARRQLAEVQTIVAAQMGAQPTLPELWPFLRLIHVMSLDLTTATAQSEAHVKTLLSLSGNDPAGHGAQATWQALVELAADRMQHAGAIVRETLPEVLRERHPPVVAASVSVLEALRDHSTTVLNGVRDTLGSDLRLPRETVVARVAEALETRRVVVVSGPAGSGKSVVAKEAVRALAPDHFVFSFRAEEFACPHLDHALTRAQIPATGARLSGVLAAQHRKVILIESVERLLEASTRDAFTDLLNLVRRDSTWRLLATCRDYSTEIVRSSLLGHAALPHEVVEVPPLSAHELDAALEHYPRLAVPLGAPRLRPLLANPYVLDKALQIDWSGGHPLPQDERQFRARLWQELVRADDHAAGGLPRRREAAFLEIALRRARALTVAVPTTDLDPEVLDRLERDSVITEAHGRVAPAHDVLEDWAILHWLDDLWAGEANSLSRVAAAVGEYPALRRSFRQWVTELVVRDPSLADEFLHDALSTCNLPARQRDDTVVALLQAPGAHALLGRHAPGLLAMDRASLHRLIHLLRVACVKRNSGAEAGSIFNVPDGSAWEALLGLVASMLADFELSEYPRLLGFVEDWSRGVSLETAYPAGAAPAASIAYHVLEASRDYSAEELRRRALKVVAKVPRTHADRFKQLLAGGEPDAHRRRDLVSEDLRKLVLEGLDGAQACRDMPAEVSAAMIDEMFLRGEDGEELALARSSIGVELAFGITPDGHFGFNPASAYRGPFWNLLRLSDIGPKYVVDIMNRSVIWMRDHPDHRLEDLERVEVRYRGEAWEQWANGRLWNLYRGTSVGPEPLQCALMALERWLLAVASSASGRLDPLLLRILEDARSCAVSAVVASVACAHPGRAPETLLALLSVPLYVRLDRGRLGHEASASAWLPALTALERFYAGERKEANALPHRKHDLEVAILALQVGPMEPRVQGLLDSHRVALPNPSEQTEEDMLWRIALNRMDRRKYDAHAAGIPGGSATEDATILVPHPHEPDVRAMLERRAPDIEKTATELNLLMWGLRAWEGRDGVNQAEWRERRLAAEKFRPAGYADTLGTGSGPPGFVAAVCARDHWDEMTEAERSWTIRELCSAVRHHPNDWGHLAQIQVDPMAPDRACAFAATLLLFCRDVPTALRSGLIDAVACGLTHPVHEVRHYAAAGIARHAWPVDADFACRSANVLANEAWQLDRRLKEWRRSNVRQWNSPPSAQTFDSIARDVALEARVALLAGAPECPEALTRLDLSASRQAQALTDILTILEGSPNTTEAVATFARTAARLAALWAAERGRRAYDERERRNYQLELVWQRKVAGFLLRTSPENAGVVARPILRAVETNPKDAASFVKSLILAEDANPQPPRFWRLWYAFAQAVKDAPWLQRVDRERARGEQEMVSAVFLGIEWRESARHWPSLDSYAGRLDEFFTAIPASAASVSSYTSFLYAIGERSLPGAFVVLAARLRNTGTQFVQNANTVYLLEVLLQRHVYGRPRELKRDHRLRDAVLFLLDLLIDVGSSAAFRMRDDFVTPLAAEDA